MSESQEKIKSTEGASERAYESPPVTFGEVSDQLRPRHADMPEPKKPLPAKKQPREAHLIPIKQRPIVTKSLKDALSVTEQEVLSYTPTDHDMLVGEALLSGASTVTGIMGYAGLKAAAVKETLNNPVAMAWISRQVEALFKTRAAVVDAAMYLRAAGGDVAAAKLFYERMRIMTQQTVRVDHVYSGGVNISALPDDELARIVREKARMLPAEFRVIEGPGAEPEEPKK